MIDRYLASNTYLGWLVCDKTGMAGDGGGEVFFMGGDEDRELDS